MVNQLLPLITAPANPPIPSPVLRQEAQASSIRSSIHQIGQLLAPSSHNAQSQLQASPLIITLQTTRHQIDSMTASLGKNSYIFSCAYKKKCQIRIATLVQNHSSGQRLPFPLCKGGVPTYLESVMMRSVSNEKSLLFHEKSPLPYLIYAMLPSCADAKVPICRAKMPIYRAKVRW